MAENTEPFGESILVKKPVVNGENVVQYNEDFKKGESVLPKGRRLSAQDIGVLAAVGCADVPVTNRPRIGIRQPETNLCRCTRSAAGPGPRCQQLM